MDSRMSYDALHELVSTRASHRKFLPDPVPEGDVRRMLESARHAPSGHNLQPWRFMPLSDRALIQELAGIVRKRMELAHAGLPPERAAELERKAFFALHFAEAPLVMAVCADGQDHLGRAVQEHFGVPVSAELARDILMQSLGAAVQNLLLAAHALGFGACWMAAPVGLAGAELESRLGIAGSARLAAIVPIGRPVKARAPAPKKSVEAIILAPG
jgi:nitroreductase